MGVRILSGPTSHRHHAGLGAEPLSRLRWRSHLPTDVWNPPPSAQWLVLALIAVGAWVVTR